MMGYSYFLGRLKEPPISSLRELGSAKVVDDWGFTMEEVRDKLSELYSTVQWQPEEVRYKEGTKPTIWGQVLDMSGRFEFRIATYPFGHLHLEGSHHVSQSSEVIKIAKALRLSVFDV